MIAVELVGGPLDGVVHDWSTDHVALHYLPRRDASPFFCLHEWRGLAAWAKPLTTGAYHRTKDVARWFPRMD